MGNNLQYCTKFAAGKNQVFRAFYVAHFTSDWEWRVPKRPDQEDIDTMKFQIGVFDFKGWMELMNIRESQRTCD